MVYSRRPFADSIRPLTVQDTFARYIHLEQNIRLLTYGDGTNDINNMNSEASDLYVISKGLNQKATSAKY